MSKLYGTLCTFQHADNELNTNVQSNKSSKQKQYKFILKNNS